MSQEVMSVTELAEYLGIAESTVYKKVEYRQVPFTKVGSLLRFPKWLIDRWLTENAVRPDASLFEEFVLLQQRYHLEQFLKGKGIDPDRLTDEQLVDELRAAIEELRAGGNA